MSNIIARTDGTDVRLAAVAILEGQLLKLSGGKVTPVAATGDAIYGVALEDQATADAEVSVQRFPFHDKEVRLLSSGDISKDDLLEPVAAGRVAAGSTRPLFHAQEAIEDGDGDGQHVRVAQLKPDKPAAVAHIADAETAHDLNATFDDTEVESALNALGTGQNAILAALEANGITLTA